MHSAAAIVAGSWHSLASVSFGALAVAVALHVAKIGAEARAWHGIVRHAHGPPRVRFRTTLGAFVSSIGANVVLPARVGEALRVGLVRRHVPCSSVVTIAATIVLEAAIEFTFGAAAIVAVLVAGHSFGLSGSAPAVSRLATHHLVLLSITACAMFTTIMVGLKYRERAGAVFARMAEGFSIVKSPRAFVAQVLSWKLVAWALRLGSVYAFLLAFHVPAAPWTTIAVIAAQSMAASVPLLPGNAGTQQAAIGVALAGSASAAGLLGFGVGMQAATGIADLMLGAVALMLVANREDLRSALRTMRVTRRARPVTA
jgi:glycosyltransferase 2 family protein